MIPAVEFRRLCKSFRGVRANSNLDLKIRSGEIHAIIGENGAGKSTAMKLLYGTYQPDSGEIYIHGRLWGDRQKPWSSPSDAIQCGIGMVHQHFMLGGPHTVLENIVLGVETSLRKWRWLPHFLRPIDWAGARKKLEKTASQYGLQTDWDAKVEDLSVGIQQRIEILKLLYHDAQILILDEPTAVLTPLETRDLFGNLKKLCKQGKTVIIITHKLKEVMNLADRVTVFRGGQVVGDRAIGETNAAELADLMVGRKMGLSAHAVAEVTPGKTVLELKEVCLKNQLRDICLNVRAGEIVGISGVEGNGQSGLLQAVLHPKENRHRMTGSIQLFGKDIRNDTTQQIKQLGVGIIPDDRLRDGLLLNRSVKESFLLGLQRKQPFNQGGLISQFQLEKQTRQAIEEYDIRPISTQILSGKLSGGNQQKLVIAREFKYSPGFVVAAQPTRGVDVGAVEFIHGRILRARAQGAGILLISSDLEEILALSDRILVMYEGKIVAEFLRGKVTEQELGLKMGGAVQ